MKHSHWIFIVAAFLFSATGCETRERDLEELKHPDPRYNREAAPPTGLKQNPARPKSYHPGTEP